MEIPSLCNVSYDYLIDDATLRENRYNSASSFVYDVAYDCYSRNSVCAYYLYELTGETLIDHLQYIMPPQHYAYAQVIPFVTLVALLCLVGIIGNLLTIVVILRNRILQTTSNYLVNMAFSDLLILLLTGPMEVAYELKAWPWTYTRFMCRLRYFLIEACTFTSILNITSFTTERYIAICHPIKAKSYVSHSRAIKIIVFIWIFSSCVSLPLFLGVDTFEVCPEIPETTVCGYPDAYWETVIDRFYIASATLLFFIPMILITIFYSLIARVLYGFNVEVVVRRNSRRARNRNGVNPNDKKENSVEKSRKQIVKMLALVAGCFAACWLPFHIIRIIPNFVDIKLSETLSTIYYDVLYKVSIVLMYTSATINPILYNIMSARFRQAFKKTILCQEERAVCFRWFWGDKHERRSLQPTCTAGLTYV
ncbi:growth hormone secretagogue receptor type 1-like [Acanthaster planci]|uniref:Thyrotropin-releasing hormone receptor n=1 Tax=Acanthaster planci TaxID=133434 RepID=A0A8B7ZLN2_ACAPL|nr:growth hormone secretagogue receptor type 1-like [Acanthaster planci]XP_022105800.1 growth hormone secretagogue receptor type 1-like [Acanthaster planci]XP_022105801.1 growth hormone secretagogue receptor type 1-like [Acanthaster planci]XP_022105802.1 growth hormone secretagogue receptor type 1-like [Acanthaster planci]XP_022105803.1 growth hormone secretagogue receptor type 1-like [Acanthaster planci]XP_022105804.1 growth hormone secretagogue receptor type 1-like [Acanthaster planci]XP_02